MAITTRLLAGAFLIKDDHFLMMKRSDTRKFYPGVWGAVGGHLEPHEINEPRVACLREINEETGLREDDLLSLDLRYIALRRRGEEIRLLYTYIGHAKTFAYEGKTDEGTLHWIRREDVLNRELSFAHQQVLAHYMDHMEERQVMAGAVHLIDNEPALEWTPVADWYGQ
jgi:8-oxo-dGTP diphosphatase